MPRRFERRITRAWRAMGVLALCLAGPLQAAAPRELGLTVTATILPRSTCMLADPRVAAPVGAWSGTVAAGGTAVLRCAGSEPMRSYARVSVKRPAGSDRRDSPPIVTIEP